MDKRKFTGLSASALRLFAMTGMLLDHAWATVVPGNFWMTCVGRMVFPLYAFQLAQGYMHTSNRKRYALRLLALALLSEIPFNLMMSGSWFFPFHQNTVFTLLLGLWVIRTLDGLKTCAMPRWKGALHLAGAAVLTLVGFVDYSWQGVLTVVLFYLFPQGRWGKCAQLAGMIVLHVLLIEGQTLPALLDLPLQSLAVLALIPIWLYNGQKGRGGRTLQYAAYLFYPLHMMLLVLLARVL